MGNLTGKELIEGWIAKEILDESKIAVSISIQILQEQYRHL